MYAAVTVSEDKVTCIAGDKLTDDSLGIDCKL